MPLEEGTTDWTLPLAELTKQLDSSASGLTTQQVATRLNKFGPNSLKPNSRVSWLPILLHQFVGPIIGMLAVAALLSFYFHDQLDAAIITTILILSGLLGFWQEYRASQAVQGLLKMVQTKTTVIRHGQSSSVLSTEVVPGDVIVLAAGASVPADCRLIEANDLFVDEASLTGESFPVEKDPSARLKKDTPLGQRTNYLFMGSHITSGSAKALITATGARTAIGQLAKNLKTAPVETNFERGVRQFGFLLVRVTSILVFLIFLFNVWLERPVLQSLLFSLALAVGLTPQLLPAIISINLAHGARAMAKRKVIVKRLAAIENFGSMNVLCCDKTGTLTKGEVVLHQFADASGVKKAKVLEYAFLAATYDSGFANPINHTIRRHHPHDLSRYEKLDEAPFDSVRQRLSLLISRSDKSHNQEKLIVVKGPFTSVLKVCTQLELGKEEKSTKLTLVKRRELESQYTKLSDQGYRVQAVAYRPLPKTAGNHINKTAEKDLIFLGWLAFVDDLKPNIDTTIRQLQKLGINLKMISGDNIRVARTIGEQVGLSTETILTGSQIRELNDEALTHQANQVSIFAEIEPDQKQRLVTVLQRAGNIVGYMGDGINDTPALHSADVSISVEDAVDVAKESADIVLLEKDLAVLVDGVLEGRRTFANTLKYVLMATSANFGNMLSVAGASLFLPFLPLLPKQILLNNFLTDLPETAIATDAVDQQYLDQPQRWDVAFIRNFMIVFGLISSLYDFLFFIILRYGFVADPGQFRTAWFIESVVSAAVIVLVIRTRGPFFRSRPSPLLWRGIIAVTLFAVLVPVSSLADPFEFTPLSIDYLITTGLVVAMYVATVELAKHFFYRRLMKR